MNFTCIFLGIIFMTIGVLFALGKGHIHLAAWKSMPQEEKDKIKIMPLCRNIGKIITLNGVIFMIKGLYPGDENHWFVISMIIWLIIAGLDVMYITKSKRYYSK